MGRRKIEIKPIRDDRNRSVTFLKRKGGLFKKAHELSVLCSVDVAVVIFGHNKKLYEYSSSDINEIVGRFQYYGGAHEHKGPADFADKNGGDDDDEEEGNEEAEDSRGTPGNSVMAPNMQNHPSLQHLRQGTPSGSPPMPNGAMPPYPRGASPLPPGASRPSSRTSQHQGHMRSLSSGLVPPQLQQHAPGTVPPPANYAYIPNPPFYNPPPGMPMAQRPPQAGPPGQATYPPQFPAAAHHPHMHAAMMQDTRRQSMPPTVPPQPIRHGSRHPSQDHLQAPGHSSPRMRPASPQPMHRPTPPPQAATHQFQSPPMPQPKPLPSYAQSNSSLFTPIDDSRSMLAQHWGSTSSADAQARLEEGPPRPQSIDTGAMARDRGLYMSKSNGGPTSGTSNPMTAKSPRSSRRSTSGPQASLPAGPTRANTNQSDAKRPRLKVQIPNEQSSDEAGTGSAADEASTSRPDTSGGQQAGPSHGVVLPPPSPSAGALLSAGAQGPPNPFARPAPPMSTNPHAANREASNSQNHVETPMSALPSRFMNNDLLPSPSTFYPEWGFGRSADTNMLPSPLNFQTPVVSNGQGWREDEQQQQQRKRAAEDGLEGEGKKSKS